MTPATTTGVRWVTSIAPLDHAVTDEDMAAVTQRGGYLGLCGERSWPVAMCAPPGPQCGRCMRVLRAQELLRSAEKRRGAPGRQHRRDACSRLRAALSLRSPAVRPSSGAVDPSATAGPGCATPQAPGLAVHPPARRPGRHRASPRDATALQPLPLDVGDEATEVTKRQSR